MFTAEQIRERHAKVKSGADFPAYIRDIKALGVTHYETYVSDGHIDYHGDDHTVKMPAKYDPLIVSDKADIEHFKTELKAHQQGKTDFLTFIKMCATVGVEKWQISIGKMTCTYFDKAGNEVLIEKIRELFQSSSKARSFTSSAFAKASARSFRMKCWEHLSLFFQKKLIFPDSTQPSFNHRETSSGYEKHRLSNPLHFNLHRIMYYKRERSRYR